MKTEHSVLSSIASHFKAAEAKFENGILILRDCFCPNLGTHIAGWRRTMYSERTALQMIAAK